MKVQKQDLRFLHRCVKLSQDEFCKANDVLKRLLVLLSFLLFLSLSTDSCIFKAAKKLMADSEMKQLTLSQIFRSEPNLTEQLRSPNDLPGLLMALADVLKHIHWTAKDQVIREILKTVKSKKESRSKRGSKKESSKKKKPTAEPKESAVAEEEPQPTTEKPLSKTEEKISESDVREAYREMLRRLSMGNESGTSVDLLALLLVGAVFIFSILLAVPIGSITPDELKKS